MKLKTKIVISLITCFLLVVVFVAVPAMALDKDYGLKTTADLAGLTKVSTPLPTLLGNLIGVVLSLVGVFFFALMIYAGFAWMTARGNQEQEKKALDTITSAIIGIGIVLASYAITTFVFDSIKSATPNVGGAPKVDVTTSKGCVAKGESALDAHCAYGEDECNSKESGIVGVHCTWSANSGEVVTVDGGQPQYAGECLANKTDQQFCAPLSEEECAVQSPFCKFNE